MHNPNRRTDAIAAGNRRPLMSFVSHPEGGFKRIVISNTGLQVFAHAITLSIALLVNYALARYLGVEKFGQLHYVFAFYYFFQTLNDFGLSTIAVREASAHPEQRASILGTVLIFRLIFSMAIVFCAWALILKMNFSGELRTALCLYGVFLPLIAMQTPAIIFQVTHDLKPVAMLGILSKLTGAGLTLVAIQKGWALPGLIGMLLIAEFFYTLGLFWASCRRILISFQLNLNILKPLLQASLFQGVTGFLVATVNRLDFLMLERLRGLSDVGLYATCYRVTSLLEALPVMAMVSIYPAMAVVAKSDRLRLQRIFQKTLLVLGGTGILMALLTMLISPWLVELLFGDAYQQAAPGLSILVWATAFIYAAIVCGNLLVVLGHEKLNIPIYAAAVVINGGLNAVLIPRYGFMGAAAATVAAYCFVFFAQWRLAVLCIKKYF